MGYIDKGDRMVNSYTIQHQTWKWTKKLFFHMLNLTAMNIFLLLLLLLTSCGARMTHRQFRLALMHNLIKGWK
jgi:hypothetical protein